MLSEIKFEIQKTNLEALIIAILIDKITRCEFLCHCRYVVLKCKLPLAPAEVRSIRSACPRIIQEEEMQYASHED